jgi:hypothetical protein
MTYLKIMEEMIAKKLRYRENYKALILNSPSGYTERLGEENIKTILDKNSNVRSDRFDFVQVFVQNPQEINELSFSVLKYLKYDAIFWIAFPKEIQKGVEKALESIENAGFESVSQVAIDENYVALRFRPEGVVL